MEGPDSLEKIKATTSMPINKTLLCTKVSEALLRAKSTAAFAPYINQALQISLQQHIDMVTSGVYFLPKKIHDPALLQGYSLHELIEIKVALGNSIQGHGLKFYEHFGSLLKERLELVDKEIEKKMESGI
eukprot:TRINITY_DN5191_c0_g1_i2.p2 TRINITY_DN5191_c0_g1~~TRINITY_DN5191_c0_g1_i2.p2  ORF type:complete len:130 (-),score=18.02 TRINITY_DN5191_c0_g1_i2:254-643(-)